jgi:hypothetical protein
MEGKERFRMQILEKIVVPGIPDVVVAGPVEYGHCQAGDRLRLEGMPSEREVTCLGIELMNWGRGREDWLSIRISDVDLGDVEGMTALRA